jgi:transcription elongation factor Elf1
MKREAGELMTNRSVKRFPLNYIMTNSELSTNPLYPKRNAEDISSCPSQQGSYTSPPLTSSKCTDNTIIFKEEQTRTSKRPKKTLKNISIKIDRLYDGTGHFRRCGDCMNHESSSHWSKDSFVIGGHICQKCYRRRRAEIPKVLQRRNIPPVRTCTDCAKRDQTSIWFKHPTIPYCFTCESCYSSLKSRTVENSKSGFIDHGVHNDKPGPVSEYTMGPLYSEIESIGKEKPTLPGLISLKHSINVGCQRKKAQNIIRNIIHDPEYPTLDSYFRKDYK